MKGDNMEYIINVWKRSHSNGTAVFYRGSDRAEFIRKKRAVVQLLHPYKHTARTAVFENKTVFSFASCADAFSAWITLDYIIQPLSVNYEHTETLERGKHG